MAKKKLNIDQLPNQDQIKNNLSDQDKGKLSAEDFNQKTNRLLNVFEDEFGRKTFRSFDENHEFFKDFSFQNRLKISDTIQIGCALLKERKENKTLKGAEYIASLKNSLSSTGKSNMTCFLPKDCSDFINNNIPYGLYAGDMFLYIQKIIEEEFGKAKPRPDYAQ